VLLYSFLTSALEAGGWSAPRPGRLTPTKDPVPIVQEAKKQVSRNNRVKRGLQATRHLVVNTNK
jgi:hypothetical protein